MNDQILELVVYKIKPDQIKNFEESKLLEFRHLIKDLEGLVHYETFSALNQEGLFIDQVEWEDMGCAKRASEKIKILQDEEPFVSIFKSFEEVKLFQHFKKIA
ncbi:MAG: hypothetical protein JXR07_15605 [Reichenbachiella sp.]